MTTLSERALNYLLYHLGPDWIRLSPDALNDLTRLLDQIAQAERERCAQLCDQEAEYARSTALDATDSSLVFVRRTQMGTAAALAAVIRATD